MLKFSPKLNKHKAGIENTIHQLFQEFEEHFNEQISMNLREGFKMIFKKLN